MNLLTVLLSNIRGGGAFFLVSSVMDVITYKDDLEKRNPILGFFIQLVTDFFDTLGIGSFTFPTTLFSSLLSTDTDKMQLH